MSYLIRITRWIDWLSLQAAKLAISLVLICALVSVLNAFSRYVFDLSSNAWLELQWYMVYIWRHCDAGRGTFAQYQWPYPG